LVTWCDRGFSEELSRIASITYTNLETAVTSEEVFTRSKSRKLAIFATAHYLGKVSALVRDIPLGQPLWWCRFPANKEKVLRHPIRATKLQWLLTNGYRPRTPVSQVVIAKEFPNASSRSFKNSDRRRYPMRVLRRE
jgi:hypothetical protein